jgi:hypothetical protein
MRGARPWPALLAVAVAVAGCGVDGIKRDAESAVKAHYDGVRKNDAERVLAGYHERFFARTSRDTLLGLLREGRAKLGELRSYRVVSWNVGQRVGTDAGTFVDVRCEVTYARFPARERLMLFRTTSAEPFRILAHNVESPGLPH